MKLIVAAIFAVLAVSAAAETENWEIDWSKVVPVQDMPGFWDGREIRPIVSPEDMTRTGRIVGGTIVTPHSIPFQAGLLMQFLTGTALCGGSVISNRAILTAAHCPIGSSSIEVVLGAHRITTVEPTQTRIVFPASSYRIHPSYNPTTFNSDIAILITPRIILFSTAVQVIPLAPAASGLFEGAYGTISGWGRISDASGATSPYLRSTDNVVIKNDVCAATFENIIYPSSICTTTGGNGACEGDTGGPLTIAYGTGRLQIGVVSFIHEAGCQRGYPVVYARVSEFRGWIDTNANP